MIIYIGNYTTDDIYEKLIKYNIRDFSQASRLYQERFIKNISLYCSEFKVLSIIPKSPLLNKVNSKIDNIVINNIYYDYKNDIFSFIREVKKFLISNLEPGKNQIIMYAVNPITLKIILKLKNKYNIKIITICSELPQFRRYSKNFLSKIKRRILVKYNDKFDKYILFSREMKNFLIKDKEFFVLEGFAPEIINNESIYKDKNIAMYAGGLAFDNGIKMMIEIAKKSKILDELWICGKGDASNYLKDINIPKVKYLGVLDNKTVIKLEKQAKVLLNLRNPNEELTKYSFPSKILEYMSTGTHVISTKLTGIPEEYYNYIHICDDYNIECITNEMEKIFNLSSDEYNKYSENCLGFVKTKQAKFRIKEILEFILK